MKNSPKSCLTVVNLVCTSCLSQYNKENLQDSEKVKRESLLNCQKKETIEYNHNEKHFGVSVNMDKLSRDYFLELYAINLAGVHKVQSKAVSYKEEILNLRAYSTKKMIYISWDKSKEHIHQGYAVNVTSSSGHCQTTIINMEFNSVNMKEHCRYLNVIRWIFLKPFVIRNIYPGTKYIISVSSIKGNYSSLPTILTVKTNIEETVKNLRVSTNSSHIIIKFGAPRGTEEFYMKYHVKVTLHGRKMCLFKYKVIFDEEITETYKSITTPLLKMCFQYEVEVLPVRQYGDLTNSVLLDTQNIDYYPTKKEGFLYNPTEKPIILKHLNVSLLSVNILKLTWSNNMPQNDCSHFGFMFESVSLENKSDCKTWIITRTSCTTLINEIEKETNCKNKEYLTLQKKWINKTLFLHGQFNIENTYKVKVWDMTDKIREILIMEVKNKDKSNDKFSNTIQLDSSKDSVTVKLPMSVSKNAVKAYILLLHSTDHKCQRYIVKTCQNCIDLTKIRKQIQRMYSSCREESVETDMKNETTFKGLYNNKEYILHVIPLLDSVSFGKVLNITTSTRLSDPMIPNYIKIQNIGNTSLQFTWNSYKNQSDSSYFDHYICILVNTMTNKKISVNYTKEEAKFTELESCTKYCLYINTVDTNGQVKLKDHICTYTLSSNPGVLSLEDIESGPSLSRLISWTRSGGDGCPRKYRVELHNTNLNKTINMTTNKTILIIDNLEKDMTYEVKVRMDSFINGKENINVPQYSKKKMFFTAQVNIKITDARSYLYPSKKKLDVLWSLEDAASGSVQSFLVRINNTMDTCLSSIVFDFQPSTDILKQTLESQHLVKRWHSLSKCTQFTKKNFTVHREDFSGTITSSGVLDNHTLSIYGLNILGIHKLYEKLLVQ